MIGTIRKHSGWLWAVIITATIVSFIFWGTSQSKYGSGGTASLGTVYGKKITRDAYLTAKKDFYLYYFFRTGKWADNSDLTPATIDQAIDQRIMFTAKAEKMGIYISDDATATAAAQRLQALGRNGQVVTLSALVEQALAPRGFTAADFENYIRHDLMLEELERSLGLSGELVTPQEAAAAYQVEHQELSAQAVFFNASNYLAMVKPTPAVLAQFYTNFQAAYRLLDRVQVSYVVFDPSNYLAQSRAEWAKTNLLENVEAFFRRPQVGETYHGAKSATEAKTIITNEFIMARAQVDAQKDANALATAAFGLEPVKPENLTTMANQKNLTVHLTAPFAKDTGPKEFESAGNFTKTAFALSADSPISEPVSDGDNIYVLALAKTLPSAIPSFEQLRFQVAVDYEQRESTLLAQRAGLAFYQTLTNQLAAGKTFATACVAAGHPPEFLPPFSTSTQDLPELEGRATLAQLRQAAYTTPLGKPSAFQPTGDGGFILLVQSKLPIDQTKMKADLPDFTERLREARHNEAFNEWFQSEAPVALKTPKSE